jgi:hypothetical protein
MNEKIMPPILAFLTKTRRGTSNGTLQPVISADRDRSAENYLSTAGDSAMPRTRWAVIVPAKETGVQMTAVQPIATVTAATARLRTDRWLGTWHAQTAAE